VGHGLRTRGLQATDQKAGARTCPRIRNPHGELWDGDRRQHAGERTGYEDIEK
jgi:hypothetical protein